ncbi:uncharacterized protein DUF4386 [Micromonospora sagamiensis]|uniref:Uncharacterized protein DUF4386 n=2 Tax=Micromonospora sagamiensis TaxID=47875 RepID=A0A562WI28_9ACTN|nr:uncharacterized protein DUF4386 [Micromonospora sagamiensis]
MMLITATTREPPLSLVSRVASPPGSAADDGRVTLPCTASASRITVYAVVFAVAITHLIAAAGLLRDDPATDRISPSVYAQITEFEEIWSRGLILFGVHLLLLGWLAWRSPSAPTWVAVLVAIAGAGYLADSIGPLISSAYMIEVAAVTFGGEIILMGWLLVFAVRSRSHRRSNMAGDGSPPSRTAAMRERRTSLVLWWGG